jgi:hypothetical protein
VRVSSAEAFVTGAAHFGVDQPPPNRSDHLTVAHDIRQRVLRYIAHVENPGGAHRSNGGATWEDRFNALLHLHAAKVAELEATNKELVKLRSENAALRRGITATLKARFRRLLK